MKSNVKSYSDAQILGQVATANGFNPSVGDSGYPTNYWFVGIRSNEDAFNTNDDKIYIFKGKTFIDVYRGTTNAGNDLLKPTNRAGEAILSSGYMLYDAWMRGFHRGKVLAYIQHKQVPVHRDNDRDRKAEELGKPIWGMYGINIHPQSYVKGSIIEREFINGWSLGCINFAVRSEFDKVMRLTESQKFLSGIVLNEW